MLTKPRYWDDLWGADGTRCDYRILLPGVEPPKEGIYFQDAFDGVWKITSISGTQMTITKITDESLFDKVLYECNMGFMTIGSTSMTTSIEEPSWFLLYTGDNDIEDESLILDKPVFTAAKPIGNTPCFTMECCLRQKDMDIPKGAWLELQTRLKNASLATDWVSLGKFKVNKRVKYIDGWVKLSCRDRMQMANQLFIKDEAVDTTVWPKPMTEVVADSLNIMGLTLDPDTVIQEGEDWMISLPLGLSIRAIWSSVAAAHGGNFIITPQDTLKLVYPRTGETGIETEVSEDGLELLGEPARVDRLSLTTNALSIVAGESGDNNIDIECLYTSPSAVLYAKSQLEGDLYTPMKVTSLVFDPLAEVYDTFDVNGILTTWSQLTVKCGIVPLADGVAEAMSEPASEYGFEDTPLNEIKSQIRAVADTINAEGEDDDEDNSFDQVTQEELFNKLTNNGTVQGLFFQGGQIYINAAYLASGTIRADLIKSGILQSADGSFNLNLDTGEFTISNMATKSDIQALKQEGVEKIVTPVMKYSMSDDGLHIQKPGEEIGNRMDHEGMEVSRGSEAMLKANKDGVLATDVTVRNFLNMGEYSRFEDYNDGSDSMRTGCFAM